MVKSLIAILALASIFAASSAAVQQTTVTSPAVVVKFGDPWQKLEQKKGWILLGLVQAKRNPWLLGLKEKRPWATQTDFEVIGESRLMPKAGDRIRLQVDFDLEIVNFVPSGEAEVQTSPVGRRITERDQTNITLSFGTEVYISDIRFGPRLGPKRRRAVWVLVSPVNSPLLPFPPTKK